MATRFTYTRKPTHVEAYAVVRGDADDVAVLSIPVWLLKALGRGLLEMQDNGSIKIMNGITVGPGHWIVRNEDGVIEGMSDDTFRVTFDKLPEVREH